MTVTDPEEIANTGAKQCSTREKEKEKKEKEIYHTTRLWKVDRQCCLVKLKYGRD
jgi:hypothetical protein